MNPSNPFADGKGMVNYPGVDTATEMVNMMGAMRSYESNVAAMNVAKTLALKALDIGGNNVVTVPVQALLPVQMAPVAWPSPTLQPMPALPAPAVANTCRGPRLPGNIVSQGLDAVNQQLLTSTETDLQQLGGRPDEQKSCTTS